MAIFFFGGPWGPVGGIAPNRYQAAMALKTASGGSVPNFAVLPALTSG